METSGGGRWPDFETMRDALSRPLPGSGAQVLMAPRPRPGWKPGRLPGDSRPGAGLVLFYPRDGDTHVVLTVRARHLPSHRGQVSFPGGAVETGESVPEAALREAQEEVGVDPGLVRVAGEATPLHIPASGYVLHPVVGFAEVAPAFRGAEAEVARILEVPFREIADPRRVKVEARVLRGLACEIPYFDLAGEKVWGATAMVLAELLVALGCPLDPWSERNDG
jgi:8-oxo-dGTP pyrophosphatase MutT (NUDIX family)